MISKVKEFKLIAIYLYICDIYGSKLKSVCERFRNNNHPDFTDQEVMTIYLYGMHVEQRLKIKHIREFAKDYLLSWFPLLPVTTPMVIMLHQNHSARVATRIWLCMENPMLPFSIN